MLSHRVAVAADAPLLAELNHRLIHDEGHRNRMTVPELEERMGNWLAAEYRAVLFMKGGSVVAYALFRPEGRSAYIRQFYVDRECRRSGIGREAMQILLDDPLKDFNRVYLDVLTNNSTAQAFWRAVGFQDYAVTMEILRTPVDAGAVAP
jgi:ribosomal protein S18 acetylase RimI-like enzyme